MIRGARRGSQSLRWAIWRSPVSGHRGRVGFSESAGPPLGSTGRAGLRKNWIHDSPPVPWFHHPKRGERQWLPMSGFSLLPANYPHFLRCELSAGMLRMGMAIGSIR
jgi:hypothetical protein